MTTPLNKSIETVVNALDKGCEVAPSDKLAHRLIMTIQRRRAGMEWLINARCKGHVRPRIRRVLWWALAEILWMDGVPKPAVVDTAVNFTKRRYSQNDASFVNAVLRGILRDESQDLFAGAPQYVRYFLPEQLWCRWCKEYGEAEAERIAMVLQQQAATVLRRRMWPACNEALPAGLQKIQSPEWAGAAELYVLENTSTKLDEYMGKDTQFYIQDMATLLAPSLLCGKPGEDIADFCAAPGGKALLIGEAMRGEGTLLCSDRAEDKLPRLKENLARLTNATFECNDAAASDFGGRLFDAIMLDVPCSNTGVIRRKPDVRWNFNESSFAGLLQIQRSILENAAHHLKPGGRIVYSTCSIEQEENQQQIASFLTAHPEFKLAEQRQLLPTTEHDGAFAALLILQ